MKMLWLWLPLLVLLLAGCGAEPPQPAAQVPPMPADASPQAEPLSMKGYELYSWQEGDAWYFAVVPGTNRITTYADITAPGVGVQGVAALKDELAQLPDNAWLYWSAQWIEQTTLPPDEVINEITAYCEQHGIRLKVE